MQQKFKKKRRKLSKRQQRRINKLKRIETAKNVVFYGEKGQYTLTKMTIDYKNVSLLKRFISFEGKILPRKSNYLSSKHQRKMTVAIKSARVAGLLPFLRH